jgi:hypothetical protein
MRSQYGLGFAGESVAALCSSLAPHRQEVLGLFQNEPHVPTNLIGPFETDRTYRTELAYTAPAKNDSSAFSEFERQREHSLCGDPRAV